ncbi:MAG TPA: hypothetical protein PLP28_11535, partial [Flavobacteriales bacterium]|nr:hypothetical protein [Flavobacteriales bacterium]
MSGTTLARQLRGLHRTVLMLETELRHGRVDEELIAGIDAQMERGIATAHGCEGLRALVDALRESTLTPRAELLSDTIRGCG